MTRNWRDLIGGIFLVLALHLGVWSVLILTNVVWQLIVLIGVIQFLYLVPVARYFRQWHRFEVVKGISIGAFITVLLNGACFGILPHTIDTAYPFSDQLQSIPYILVVIAITIVMMLITFYAFNRRSGKDRSL
jgi:hypothetical protein